LRVRLFGTSRFGPGSLAKDNSRLTFGTSENAFPHQVVNPGLDYPG
jgi:hypothetical protein